MSQAGVINLISNNPNIPTTFVEDTGSATPLANVLKIVGAGGITTSGAGNTVTISGGAGGLLQTLTGNAGPAVTPDGSHNINILLAHTNILVNGVSHTLTADFLDITFGNLIMGSTVAQTLNPLTAQNLTGYGSAALNSVVSSRYCVALGGGALESLTTGFYNTMTGASAGANLLSSSSNTGNGYGALTTCVSGTLNTAIGALALTSSLGSNNVAVGANAGVNYTGTESANVLINNAGVLGESNVTRIGTAGSQTSAYVSGITGVTVAASAPVGVASTGQLSSLGFGTLNYILTSNGAGNSPTWQPNSASGDITSVLTANATPQFSLVGTVETVDFNLNNLALGSSLPSLTVGTQNVAMGSAALASITSGSLNTVIGFEAATAMNSGTNNVAIGASTLISGNGTGCVGNTAVGTSAMSILTTGRNNTSLGFNALGSITTGTNNISIGYTSGTDYNSSESYNIAIGNVGVISESNVTRIGTPFSAGTGQSSFFAAGITGVTVAASSPVGVNSLGQLSDLGFGTAGQVFTSTGAASSPVWANGASVLSLTSVTHGASPYTVLAADEFLACQTSGGVITIKLPNAPTTGRVIHIKDSNGAASVSNISVTTVGGTVTIDGQTTFTMSSNYQSVSVIFDGSNYEVF